MFIDSYPHEFESPHMTGERQFTKAVKSVRQSNWAAEAWKGNWISDMLKWDGWGLLQNTRIISYYMVYDMIWFTMHILNYNIPGLTL